MVSYIKPIIHTKQVGYTKRKRFLTAKSAVSAGVTEGCHLLFLAQEIREDGLNCACKNCRGRHKTMKTIYRKADWKTGGFYG